jgi:hypothetical protein
MIDVSRVILSVQRALLGEVSPALRGVAVELSESVVWLRFYYDGEISEEDSDSATSVVAEVAGDLARPVQVRDSIDHLDTPAPLPSQATWVYRRRE